MTRTAVVILNWNGREFLQQFLPALIRHTPEAGTEIIIGDNASTDDSLEFLKQNYPDLRIIRLDKNYGFAGGYNAVLRQVEAEYYLLLNSDIEVTEDWLQPLVEHLDTQPSVAACSPILLEHNRRNMLEYAGAAGGYIDQYGYAFCRGRLFHTTEPYSGEMREPTEVFWTTGACMLIRAELFRRAGGFDDAFFAHMEEIDLCWRLKNRGHQLTVVPASVVYHVGGGTLPKSNPFKTFLNFRNNLLLLFKNLPDEVLQKTIRIRMLLDGISALHFLLRFKFADFRSVYKAHQQFRSMKAEYLNFRENSDTEVERKLHPEIYMKSIVYDYFIAGRKKFSELRDHFANEMDDRVLHNSYNEDEG